MYKLISGFNILGRSGARSLVYGQGFRESERVSGGHTLSVEGVPQRHELIQDHPEGPHVRRRVVRLLLGGGAVMGLQRGLPPPLSVPPTRV